METDFTASFEAKLYELFNEYYQLVLNKGLDSIQAIEYMHLIQTLLDILRVLENV